MTRQAPRLAIALMLALLLGGGAYLYAVRGQALLIDLATSLSTLMCF